MLFKPSSDSCAQFPIYLSFLNLYLQRNIIALFCEKSYFFSKCPDKNSISITLLSCVGENIFTNNATNTSWAEKYLYLHLHINFYDQRPIYIIMDNMAINKM